MTKFIDLARAAVDGWRANDGGLTLSASDVTQTGHWLDRQFADLTAGVITRQQLADILADQHDDCLAAVGDLMDAARAHLDGLVLGGKF